MTPSELVSAVRSLGCQLLVRGGELRIRRPNPAPPELPGLLELIRQDREGVKAVLDGPICIRCHVPVPPDDLFCHTCFAQTRIGQARGAR